MKLTMMLMLAVVLSGCIEGPSAANRFPKGRMGTDDLAPDISKGSTERYVPTVSEVERFYDLFRYYATRRDVLRYMGHPMAIRVSDSDGMERWKYPWGDSCIVVFDGDHVFENVYIGPKR